MAVQVDIENLMADYKKRGGSTNFPDSLTLILELASEDDKLNSINHLAYLLATAKAESDYSLERWEADYLCGEAGVKYKNKPCKSALDYYCSTTGGKQNYCKNKPKDKNGLPYFGRGLIQITWKENYEKYGEKIGVDLVKNPEKIFIQKNSYYVSVAYLKDKKGQSKKSAFDWADENNLTMARKSVNGGTRDIEKVNKAYVFWKDLLKDNGAKVVFIDKSKENNKKIWIGIGISLLTIGVTGTLLYYYLKKNNKLPNFINKIKL